MKKHSLPETTPKYSSTRTRTGSLVTFVNDSRAIVCVDQGQSAFRMNGHPEKPEMNGHATSNGRVPSSKDDEKKPNVLQRIANKIIWFFETGFEK